ncbi:MAG: ArsI/CadI family heavy metal resistance metalloenzyme [Sneathiellaceae bacterium]
MKRFHISLAVDDLDASVAFYSGLFGAGPSVQKPDYAKWMLDDPRVNLAISTRGKGSGLDHLGIQAESQDELREVQSRLDGTGGRVIPQGETTCCYAKSEKSWVFDPQGIAWETFFTSGESTVYGEDLATVAAPVADRAASSAKGACCAPGA